MDGTNTTAATEARQAAVLLAAIEAMEVTLSVAETLVTQGRRIDLAGLETEVERLCGACLAAPRSAVPAVRARLEGLLRLHDRLQGALPRP